MENCECGCGGGGVCSLFSFYDFLDCGNRNDFLGTCGCGINPPTRPPTPPSTRSPPPPPPRNNGDDRVDYAIRLPGLDFCLDCPPELLESTVHGLQHNLLTVGAIGMFSSTFVDLMGGGNVEKAQVNNTLLFVAGVNTLFQSFFGTRLPVVMGTSYAYVIPTHSIAMSRRFNKYCANPRQRFKHSMRAIQGAMIVASLFQMLLGFLGLGRIFARSLSPLAAVPLVTLTGLGLFTYGFPQVANCIEIGLPALLLLIFLSEYLPNMWDMKKSRRAKFYQYGVLVSVGIMWAYAEVLTAAGAYDHRRQQTQQSCSTDRSKLIRASRWVRVPYPFQWGRPSFNVGDAFAMMGASLVASIESTGTQITAFKI
ncbi:Nucleobase-ascorbate transporter [Quillaja saponaria]|uniref:Nucleobase-ascorbate transporter n=1 Tax=Quillaja saponaria TaxID=32244 RepID=A0AAD7PLX9_QUISA|nr:Nucleobase-ascorbate transporter [Quillaja saponaria]